jgi:hypothetical protein
VLTSVMLPVARTSGKVRSTSASPEEIDVVIELGSLSRALVEHSRRVLTGEQTDWAEISNRLGQAATTCRRQVIIESPAPRATQSG